MTRHVVTVAAIAALLGSISLAQAQSDPELLRGGTSKKGAYNIFGFDGTDLGRTTVRYDSKYAPGTIVINTAERWLYLIQENGSALRYGIGGWLPVEGHAQDHREKRISRLDAATGDDRAAKGCAEAYEGRRSGQSARQSCDVSRQHTLPDSRLERSGFGRRGGIIRLLPDEERGHRRSL